MAGILDNKFCVPFLYLLPFLPLTFTSNSTWSVSLLLPVHLGKSETTVVAIIIPTNLQVFVDPGISLFCRILAVVKTEILSNTFRHWSPLNVPKI